MSNNTPDYAKTIITRLRRPSHHSHWFVALGDPDDGDVRCGNCDCRPRGRWAHLPCGTTNETYAAAEAEYVVRYES